LDLLIGFSGVMAAGALVWITVALVGAILLGGAVAGVFGSIFFGMSRLARIADRRRPLP
jgi:predicted methyltransferase MtxX (methanogen marker protein 4)